MGGVEVSFIATELSVGLGETDMLNGRRSQRDGWSGQCIELIASCISLLNGRSIGQEQISTNNEVQTLCADLCTRSEEGQE